MKKYIVLIPDGVADRPLPERQHKTILELADLPNMNQLLKYAEIGQVQTVPDSLKPGSDVANLSIFGYNPETYYTGRAPIEAVSQGIKLTDDEVVYRANLSYVDNGKMKDFTAGHISNDEARQLIMDIDKEIRRHYPKVSLYPGVSYRNLLKTHISDVDFTEQTYPPHDLTGQSVHTYFPQRSGIADIMDLASSILSKHPVNVSRVRRGIVPANTLWLWGQGRRFDVPSFQSKFQVHGGVISAVDLIKGIGLAAGLEYIQVPGITGFIDTDFRAKAEYALEFLEQDGNDIVFVHVEAPDEAGHMGDIDLKIKAMEYIDERIIGTFTHSQLFDNLCILILPDHATPIELKTHSSEAVPYLMYDKTRFQNKKKLRFTEGSSAQSAHVIDKGYQLIEKFVTR